MTAAPPPEPGGLLPIEDYVASLARKRMGAGALFRDGAGRRVSASRRVRLRR